MPPNNADNGGSTYPLIADALPDLIIGLVGVPVGLAAQQIAKSCLGNRLGLYMLGLAFIVCIYALYSVALLLVFEDAVRRPGAEPAYLGRLVMVHLPVSVFLVASLIALGHYFGVGEEHERSLLVISTLIPVTVIQPLSVLLSRGRVLEYLQSNRPVAHIAYQASFLVFLFLVFCFLL